MRIPLKIITQNFLYSPRMRRAPEHWWTWHRRGAGDRRSRCRRFCPHVCAACAGQRASTLRLAYQRQALWDDCELEPLKIAKNLHIHIFKVRLHSFGLRRYDYKCLLVIHTLYDQQRRLDAVIRLSEHDAVDFALLRCTWIHRTAA